MDKKQKIGDAIGRAGLDILYNHTVFLAMPRYPALTIKELKAIQEANKGNPEVRRLLWEIRRLHEVLFRFDTHLRHLNCNASYLVENAQASCVVLLDSEPAVRWRNAVEERKRRRDRGCLDHYRPRP